MSGRHVGSQNMLTELTQVPEALYEAEATELHSILGGPTLIHLAGRRPEPLFLSVLLHGNENFTVMRSLAGMHFAPCCVDIVRHNSHVRCQSLLVMLMRRVLAYAISITSLTTIDHGRVVRIHETVRSIV